MMERSPRDFKKPELAESGKPDLNMPLSTIAKLRGGTSNSSPFPTIGNSGASITALISPLQLSTMDFAPKLEKGKKK